MKTKDKEVINEQLLEFLKEYSDEDKSKILSFAYNHLRDKLKNKK